jgi:hypothetical protein
LVKEPTRSTEESDAGRRKEVKDDSKIINQLERPVPSIKMGKIVE